MRPYRAYRLDAAAGAPAGSRPSACGCSRRIRWGLGDPAVALMGCPRRRDPGPGRRRSARRLGRRWRWPCLPRRDRFSRREVLIGRITARVTLFVLAAAALAWFAYDLRAVSLDAQGRSEAGLAMAPLRWTGRCRSSVRRRAGMLIRPQDRRGEVPDLPRSLRAGYRRSERGSAHEPRNILAWSLWPRRRQRPTPAARRKPTNSCSFCSDIPSFITPRRE